MDTNFTRFVFYTFAKRFARIYYCERTQQLLCPYPPGPPLPEALFGLSRRRIFAFRTSSDVIPAPTIAPVLKPVFRSLSSPPAQAPAPPAHMPAQPLPASPRTVDPVHTDYDLLDCGGACSSDETVDDSSSDTTRDTDDDGDADFVGPSERGVTPRWTTQQVSAGKDPDKELFDLLALQQHLVAQLPVHGRCPLAPGVRHRQQQQSLFSPGGDHIRSDQP